MTLRLKKLRTWGFFLIALFVGLSVQANAGLPLKKVMNVMVLSEAFTSSIISLIHSETIFQKQEINWSGVLAESEWWICVNGKLNNKTITACYSGKLMGSLNKDISVLFNGYGIWGSSPFEISGRASFPYDKEKKDYVVMQIEQRTRFGKSSLWGWINASEYIVGGSIGAAGAIIATSPTGPGAIIIGLAGALGGSASAVAISDKIEKYFKQSQPPPKPTPSPQPSKDFKPDQKIQPTKDNILLAVEPNLKFTIIHSNIVKASGSIDGDIIHAQLQITAK